MLIPVEGCLVKQKGNDQIRGEVVSQEENEGIINVSVQWLDKKNLEWITPEKLTSGFGLGASVQDLPRSRTRDSLGVGEVVETRQMGGRCQHLIEFPDTGERVWFPYENLRYVRGAQQRFLLGQLGNSGHAEHFRLRALAYAIETWHENTGALSRLNIDPLPHQIHLVHHILKSGNLNWLIADDVGLGKTIEVGMLLSALKQRGNFKRVLLITPAGLVKQWKEEMHHKFALSDFRIYGEDFFINEEREWRLYDHVIGSLDKLKQEDHLNKLMQSGQWDVIVFDEAHRLSRSQYGMKFESSDRFQLAKKLRTLTDSMLLLSATPHQGKQDKFQTLLELIRPEWRERIQWLSLDPSILTNLVIRNNKADVTDAEGNFIFSGKITKAITVQIGTEEQAFDQALQKYLKRGYAAGKATAGTTGRAIGFVMTVYRKLTASSIAAIEAALVRRMLRLKAENEFMQMQTQSEEPEDERYYGEWEEVFESSQKEFFSGEITLLEQIISLARNLLAVDRKIHSFVDGLVEQVLNANSTEKILIFSEYRATQEYIASALRDRFGESSVALIHGSMSHEQRAVSIGYFEESGQFLVSTEAGGEGINLQRNCHIMVNFDLPWNPMRLVQRVGRLYRYGQKRKVIVFNMHTPQTLDADIIQMLYLRIGQVVRDMAVLGGEYLPGLEDEIMGEMADFLDVENILESATDIGIERTEERINEALEKARESVAKQRELFEHISGFNPEETKGEFKLNRNHVKAFVFGMCNQLGIEVVEETHKGAVFQLKFPDELRERLGFRATYLKVTFEHEYANYTIKASMMDFETAFFRFLVQEAKKLQFDGLLASINGLQGEALFTAMLRWQNDQGRRMRQEFTATLVNSAGQIVTNTSVMSDWLLQPALDGDKTGSREHAKILLKTAIAAMEMRLGKVANDDLHPENRQLINSAWINTE